jgi:hypothetical protein
MHREDFFAETEWLLRQRYDRLIAAFDTHCKLLGIG